MKIRTPEVSFRWMTPNDMAEIASAARLCYQSAADSGKTNEELVRMLMRKGHWPMFDHASASYQVVADRGWSHEQVRHRIGVAYAQESTRWCNYTKGRFGGEIAVAPYNDGLTQDQLTRRRELFEEIQRVYASEVNEGVKPQQARDVLPTCLKTEMRLTLSYTAWFHLFDLRLPAEAHPRMRGITEQILDDLCRRSQVFRLWRLNRDRLAEERMQLEEKARAWDNHLNGVTLRFG